MPKYCELVADIASYQPDTLAFFRSLRVKKVRAVIIKLTEGSATGSAYVNPKAAMQVKHALEAGLLVHVYHYAKFRGQQDAKDEADWFIKHVRKLGITSNSVLALDIEDKRNNDPATADANTFLQRVKSAGYPRVDVYSMASWFWNGRLDVRQLIAKNLWVANYGVPAPGVANVGLWQYTNVFDVDGVKLDMNYDFNGFYTKLPLTVKNKVVTNKGLDNFIDVLGDKWFYQHGRFTTHTAIRLRWGAKITSGIITLLPANSVIDYDAYSFHDGYIWLRQPRSNNKFGYLVSGEEHEGHRTNYWGVFGKTVFSEVSG
ncbi:endolysin [Liquorilactobacillus aquaticus DSM 21051]|uniref:Endolysin n=1 Tax=Liquorilactobacillus aquaticus DSM 21051 TaxID=1423725 RepID=A0A0R2D4J6_9LACO|nr:GH25 family lysozyme [Liquorilactobacillus aquaticus]KRM95084.1 endolysin [Liquorilactobacillus aquaticus DSM 21051]